MNVTPRESDMHYASAKRVQPGAPWREHAACKGQARVMEDHATQDVARRICRACPVIGDCHAWVMSINAADAPDGITAGQTPAERSGHKAAATARNDRTGKTCTGCKEIKPLTEYHAHPHSHDGLTSRCKPCSSDAKRRRNQQKEMSST